MASSGLELAAALPWFWSKRGYLARGASGSTPLGAAAVERLRTARQSIEWAGPIAVFSGRLGTQVVSRWKRAWISAGKPVMERPWHGPLAWTHYSWC